MNISIKFIPTAQMRYATLGDWRFDENGDLIIEVANDDRSLPSEDGQLLVALHELIEVILCRKRGITQQQVDDWDMSKAEYANENGLELGDMEGAPYAKEHRFACLIEYLMAHELGIEGYGKIK